MSRYERIPDDDGMEPDECIECGAEAHLYDDGGEEVWLCDEHAGIEPACGMCGGTPADVRISGGGVVCRRCAAEEEGDDR